MPDRQTLIVQESSGQVKVRMERNGRKLEAWGGIFDKVVGNKKEAEQQEEGHTLRVPKASSGDSVASYFAMRKSSMGKTPDGGLRPMINNEFVFQTGMLDQVTISIWLNDSQRLPSVACNFQFKKANWLLVTCLLSTVA